MLPASRIPMAAAVLAGILGVGILGMPAPGFAQFNFLFGPRGGTDFTPEDWNLFTESLRQVLERSDPGSRGDWSNPKTGFHGDIMVESDYEREGLSCRHVRFNIMRAQKQIPYRMNFCKTDEGTWAIAP